LPATAGGWVPVALDVRLYLRDEITTQLMVAHAGAPAVGRSPPAPGTVHGAGPRRVPGPNRHGLAFRRSFQRLSQNLPGQLAARTVQVGVSRDPRLRGTHQLLDGSFALFLGDGAFLITPCVGEEGG